MSCGGPPLIRGMPRATMTVLIRLVFVVIGVFAVALSAHAADPDYPAEVARWKEMPLPSASNRADRMVWDYAANSSPKNWRVLAENGQIHARLMDRGPQTKGERPNFAPVVDRLHRVAAFSRVDDGWLVGFNQGEFGAALYWFSADGQQNYKISGHQVVEFFTLEDGVHAIEGLAHGVFIPGTPHGRGSIVRISRPSPDARWQASTGTTLPGAPFSIVVRRDGSMLVTLFDSLVSVGKDGKITTLLADAPWGGLYPNSSVLSADEQKLFVGMRQYVAEIDIPTRTLRILLPSAAFLNALSANEQQRIRNQYNR